jgi:cation:H+ antiporter
MTNNILLVIGGLALLVIGAQSLVRGASKLAVALGIPPLIVGLTIVSFGTSAPELAVSVQSALAGNTGIVLGNVVGANIYNVLFILGFCALITPLGVASQLIRFDVPVMIACALLLLVVTRDGNLGRLEGVVFLVGIVIYTVYVILQSRREKKEVTEDYARQTEETVQPDRRYWLHLLMIVVGIGLLGYGSDLLVDGAVSIAQALGVADVLIGMTVVTIGTTSPELSASLVAAFKGAKDIAVGNIVGSNIFNILCVLGAGSVVASGGIGVDQAMLSFGIPVMTAVCIACLPVFFAGQAIRRWEGALFLVYFVIYLGFLILWELDYSGIRLRNALIFLIAPITVVAVSVSVYRELQRRQPA